MGWIESKEKSNRLLVQAIKDLRNNLGDTQIEFASRLSLSKRAVANYETDVRPTVLVLARLAKIASDAGIDPLTNVFTWEIALDIGLQDIKGGVIAFSSREARAAN